MLKMYGCGSCIRLLPVAFVFLLGVCPLAGWEHECMLWLGSDKQQCFTSHYTEVWVRNSGRVAPTHQCQAHTTRLPLMSPTVPSGREEMNLKYLSEENVKLVISGCSVDERDSVGSTATIISKQLRSVASSTKKILPTTSHKIPSSLYGINPQLFLPSRVLNFPSLMNNDIDLVRTGRLPTCHSHSAETYQQEQNQAYYSCCQLCMQSCVPKTLKIDNLYEFNCMSTQDWGNSNIKKNFPQENSPMLQTVGMGTVVLVGTFYSQTFTEEMSKLLSTKSLNSSVDEVNIDKIAEIFDNLYSDISCTKVIHESTESLVRSTKGNEVTALYHMTAEQRTLGFWHFKEPFSNDTYTHKIRPKQRTNSISRKIHTPIIVYTTSPVNSEVLEFRTRYIKASPDPVTDIRMKQDKHCRTCKTERFVETSSRSKPRKIMATSASLYFPEPVTRSASLLHIAWRSHIKRVNNDSRTSDKVISLTKPPDIIPEPSTKFICKSDIKTFHSLDSDALISLFVDYSSIWTTHQILSSASPSLFPEPETFFWYQTDTKPYDTKVPESVTLESSLRSFPDVTLGYTEMHPPMTASWGQHFAS